MDTLNEHPHESHKREYLILLAAAVIGSVILWKAFAHLTGNYFFVLEQLFMAVMIWTTALKLPTSASREGAALMLGCIFGLMMNMLLLIDTSVVISTTTAFMYRLIFTVPVYVVSAIIMTLPAVYRRGLFVVGVITALLLNYAFSLVGLATVGIG